MTKVPPEKRILNKEQKKAVEYGTDPLLIIAGAGTGKTTVITERVKYLISSKQAKPSEILALTFTEKASREMEERIDQVVPYGYTNMWISTFHAFCDLLLRDEAVHIGLTSGFRLLSETDSSMLFRKHLFSFNLDYFRPLGNPTKFISGILQHFSRLKDEDITPNQYFDWVNDQFSMFNNQKDQTEEKALEIKKLQELARVYQQYEELKVKEGVMDFADLIANTLLLFRKRTNVLSRYKKQFKYILIDEFQDTNIAQYELIKLLAPPREKPNLTIVGDDNQSIYKFRGAAVSNILGFKKDYKNAAQIVLNKNYRSYQYILDSAYKLIKHNDPDTLEAKLKISKDLKSMRGNIQKQVLFLRSDRIENEAESVGKKIKEHVKNNAYTWKDIAVLVRANNHADAFTRTFARLGIPYQFLGPGQLFKQPEVKNLIAYLQVLHNFEDDVALSRVLFMDYFDFSTRDLVAIHNFSKKYNVPLFEACEVFVGGREIDNARVTKITDKTKEKLTKLLSLIAYHLSLLNRETAGQLLYYFLDETGMMQKILEYKFPIDEKKAGNVAKFFSKLKNYEAEHEDASVATTLDWILLAMELGESPAAATTDWMENDAVNILTVHSSKGLEFPIVFLVNLVSQRFPTRSRREQITIPDELIKEELPKGDFHAQEERRLFYVGMTRARDHLYLTAANYYGEAKREKKMSPFITEALGENILQQLVKKDDAQLTLFGWKKTDSGKSFNNAAIKPLAIAYLSYSQLNTFQMCPLHYKLKYLLDIPPARSPALSFGNSVHTALKDFYQSFKSDKSADKKALLKYFNRNWEPAGYTSKKHEEKFKKLGEKYLSEFYKKHAPFTTVPIATEQSFTVNISDGKRELKIGGRIDRIDDLGNGTIEIIDYKTGKAKKQKDVDKSLQLSMYAMAATDIVDSPLGKKPDEVILSMYYLDTQEKISTARSTGQLEKEKEKILDIAAKIEQSDFRCSNHMLCKNCEYKLFCGVE